jgi:hypothetical protein
MMTSVLLAVRQGVALTGCAELRPAVLSEPRFGAPATVIRLVAHESTDLVIHA